MPYRGDNIFGENDETAEQGESPLGQRRRA